MEKNKATAPPQCLNCQADLNATDQYCSACGQKNTTGRIRFRQLVGDFFDNFLNLDSRTFLTLRKLPIPGFLTREYFNGRHRSYLNPLRLFLISTILLVAVITWKLNDGINRESNFLELMETQKSRRELVLKIDSLRQRHAAADAKDSLVIAIDTLTHRILGSKINRNWGDSVDIDRFMTIAQEDYPPMLVDDVLHGQIDTLVVKYKIEGVWRQFLFQQKVKMIRDSRSFLRYLVGRISWGVLILIPLLALFMRLLYILRPFYYVEHFIFAMHVHSFLFILAAFQLWIVTFLPLWTIAVTSTLFTFYLLFAMKRFYGQNWWKTFFKFFLLSSSVYWIIFSVALIIAAILGILLF